MKHEPETPLPWKSSGAGYLCGTSDNGWVVVDSDLSDRDAEYIQHACNAYPKLVKALRRYCKNGFLSAEELLKELGEL